MPPHELSALGVGEVRGGNATWTATFQCSLSCVVTDEFTVFVMKYKSSI